MLPSYESDPRQISSTISRHHYHQEQTSQDVEAVSTTSTHLKDHTSTRIIYFSAETPS
ncbi:hypothetical protein GJ744_008146 [Endocarpon pusillum]|uniref:Uncharacterized protein n=1 Tax=Endocarpon pusillum TaxID=364733 RepID=A0A8H7AJS6_9EURO|nr:hypothetical protein GJ744_008146 [Endocarpon pusillum]